MRVAVFGSSETSNEVRRITDPEGVGDFCRSLGRLLSNWPHTVLVASDSQRSADSRLVDGILSSATRRAKIAVYHRVGNERKEGRPPFDQHQPRDAFDREAIHQEHVEPVHLWMLHEADVAIVVGGGKHAYAAGLAAAFTGCRLIPVAAFGGAARQLWLDFRNARERPRAMRGLAPRAGGG